MKKPLSPHMVAVLALGLIAPLSAQNLACNSIPSESGLNADGNLHRSSAASAMHGAYDVFDLPATSRAVGEVSDDPAVFAAQEATTLDSKAEPSRNVDSVVDLGVLRNPSPYRKIFVSSSHQPYEISEDGLQSGLALISAVYREAGKSEKSSDCSALALSVEQQVKLNPSQVLEIVEREVGANPGCSCEIVKTAIKFSDAGVKQVVAIVDVAIHASPESMRIVSQCAIAAMPDSIAAVQALLAKLDPNAGETGYSSKSAKSSKDSKVASIVAPPIPNPLDLPVSGPPLTPLPVFPQEVTNVNPCGPAY